MKGVVPSSRGEDFPIRREGKGPSEISRRAANPAGDSTLLQVPEMHLSFALEPDQVRSVRRKDGLGWTMFKRDGFQQFSCFHLPNIQVARVEDAGGQD